MAQARSAADWLGLDGRVCAGTGAGSGTGAAIAEGLAAVGAKVALIDRNGDAASTIAKRLADAGARVLAIGCDVTDQSAVGAGAFQARDIGCSDVIKLRNKIAAARGLRHRQAGGGNGTGIR